MNEVGQSERILLRIGAVCAILGAIISVASGAGFGNLTNEARTEAVLRAIASRPPWYWPAVHLGFIVGALLWVAAFLALASTLRQGARWALGRLAVAGILIGAAIHIIDSTVSGVGLTRLANAWAGAPPAERADLLRAGDVLLLLLDGMWWGVIGFFHGVPFLLLGWAAALSPHYAPWLAWLGIVGGAGSLVVGAWMILGVGLLPAWLFIVFAILVSLFMVFMGIRMWPSGAPATV